MPNPNDNRGTQRDDRQSGGREDDRMPGRGNPGGEQVKNMPGEGARRADQGGGGTGGQRNEGTRTNRNQ